ncbi:hypothetical protein ACEWY4_010465 [Coilia grayii]|uniref:DDE Tnp4 domain-containing protein n=1 Tax=Coilia grayii TaxID=363190 RepID=A0ABD1K2M0_9TELE
MKEASARDVQFQQELLVVKRAKLELEARRLLLAEQKLARPALSVPVLWPEPEGEVSDMRNLQALKNKTILNIRPVHVRMSIHVFQDSAIAREAAMSRGEWRLIGDSGYPLRTYLFTPVANPQDGREAAYNKAHRLARGIVERSIGRWK